jgi:hypothetical protein
MATDLEFFNVGTIVSCKTCLDKEIEGEVLAFDANTRMLILKSEPCSGRTNQNNVHMLNLSFVSDIHVRRESKEKPPEPNSLNIQRLNGRARAEIDKKKKLVTALRAGVSPEGQRLFGAINKTLDEVHWSGEDIVVMKNVRIVPPYNPDCVRGESVASNHVRKIVEKHVNEREELKKQIVGSI